MGRRRTSGRKVTGVLLLDKPIGMTSNAALQKVKRLFRARKAGHTGSLDPLASGLLPICMGEATKISSFLLNADKRYRTEVTLGVKTTTADAEGEVLETRPVGELTSDAVEQVLDRFRGQIEQVPPMHSAIKVQGEPLYKLAHQGIEVERQPRAVTIYQLDLLALEADRLVLDIRCSKGTYVRTLAEDIGEALGCGGHVSALRRTEVGHFSLDSAVTMERLEADREGGPEALDVHLLPTESVVDNWPDVRLSDDAAYYLRMGQAVLVPRAPTEGWVRLYENRGGFMGVGEVLDDGRVAPKRLLRVA